MNWYVVDKNYVKYLTSIDEKVGYVEYGDRMKLHVGIILDVNSIKYYVPISSPKRKHFRMSNSVDFHKIEDPSSNFLYAVVNINNMIPVPDNMVVQLKYNEVQKFRTFVNDKERVDYIYLLQKEKAIIDSIATILQEKALRLYNSFVKNPKSNLSKRCCDFVSLEKASKNYIKTNIYKQED